jgi:PAS domain S-box-containing protein
MQIRWSQLLQGLRTRDAFETSPLRKAPYCLVAVFIALAHFGAALLTDHLLYRAAQVLPLFPGSALDLAILLVFGLRYWPVLYGVYFATSVWRQVPWLASFGIASAGLIQSLIAAWIVRCISGSKKLFGDFEDLAAMALAAVVAPGWAAALGTACLIASGKVPPAGWTTLLVEWWVVDGLGILASAPVLVGFARLCGGEGPRRKPGFLVLAALYLAAIPVACHFIFVRADTRYFLFSVFLLIWIAALCIGPVAARTTAAMIAYAAIWATRNGMGPFSGRTLGNNLQNVVLFVAALSLTGMAVGAFRKVRNPALPGGVLLAGWAISGWLYASMDRDRVTYDQARFEELLRSVEARIQNHLDTYEGVLWGAAGNFEAAGRITSSQWDTYASHLHSRGRLPGSTGISILRADPSNPQLGAAAEARDTGEAVWRTSEDRSGKILQLFIPVYREHVALINLGERRSALMGWVVASVPSDSLFRPALAGLEDAISLRVYDGENTASSHSLFRSGPAQPERLTHLTFRGGAWTLVWSRLPGFPYLSRAPSAWAAGCTALLSLVLAGVVLNLQTTKREASDRLKLIQSASAVGTWELDLHSMRVDCSEEFLQLYGIRESREQLSLGDWLRSVHPDERHLMRRELMAVRGAKGSIDRQYRVIWPDGSTHWIHSKALSVQDERGEQSRIVGVDFDISELKQLQAQLAQAQKLESIGQLAAGVAHEINTPIQYIGDNARFLDEAFRDVTRISSRTREAMLAGNGHAVLPNLAPGEEPEEALLEYLNLEVPNAISQLLEGVDQVARMVRAMKEFAHPGSIEKAAIDLNHAIESTIMVCRNEWKYVAELTTDLDPNLPPVPAIAGELNQAILNLVVNAAQAISDVFETSGQKGRIHISTHHKDGAAEVRVSDTGSGIPEDIRSKIFDPFFTTKPVGKGTGQGLAIAHAVIVQKHKGTLRFETEAGRGSTFIIDLPLACAL